MASVSISSTSEEVVNINLIAGSSFTSFSFHQFDFRRSCQLYPWSKTKTTMQKFPLVRLPKKLSTQSYLSRWRYWQQVSISSTSEEVVNITLMLKALANILRRFHQFDFRRSCQRQNPNASLQPQPLFPLVRLPKKLSTPVAQPTTPAADCFHQFDFRRSCQLQGGAVFQNVVTSFPLVRLPKKLSTRQCMSNRTQGEEGFHQFDFRRSCQQLPSL